MVKKSIQSFMAVVSLVLLLSHSASADVKVYAEGTYTDDYLTVNIYADTTATEYGAADPLVSYGVKMTYNSTDLNNPDVTKNDADWYFGSASSPLSTPNAYPDTTTDGEVVIIGGKIDETEPTVGVYGPKVLLASVEFSRISTTVPSVSLGLGKGGNFANFVTTVGHELDDTARLEFMAAVINPECNLVGDLNGDGTVDMADYGIFSQNYGQTGPNDADLNGDGTVDMADYGIFSQNYGSTCP